MKKVTPIFTFILTTLFFGCSDETTYYEEPKNDLILETNEGVLENSLDFDNAGVLDVLDATALSGKSATTALSQLAGNYPLTLVAQVNVPYFNGAEDLTASHVAIADDYAYVAYNTAAEAYIGGVDVINISDPLRPRVTSRLYYINADINSIAYDNGYVYIVGGVNAELSARATENSFVAKIAVSNGRLDLGAGITYGFQPGFNANDVSIDKGMAYVTSGKDGYVTVYDTANLSKVNEAPFSDLRSIAIKDNTIAVLDAGKGVNLLGPDLGIVKEIAIATDFGPVSKKTLDIQGENILVAEGAEGAGKYNMASGALIAHIPIALNPENVADSDKVTNAVACNQEVLLMANGGAGLSLLEERSNNTHFVGVIQLEGSVNYVASKGDYIFAATGKQGLQIIKMNRPNESLVNKCIDLPYYNGNQNVIIENDQNLAYKGAKRLNTVKVSGSLLLCGSWTVKNHTTLYPNSLMEMKGTYIVGNNNNRKSVTLEKGSTLRIEGNLAIYGDLILNEGSTLEFLGEDSVVNIFGKVIRNGNVTVKGTFKDARNKF